VMEDEFINASGTDITPAFLQYLMPLLGADLPESARLRHNPVAKLMQV
jgi:ATP-dependent phosphofructokinase / diphosphate-dependent phosphofructokinase